MGAYNGSTERNACVRRFEASDEISSKTLNSTNQLQESDTHHTHTHILFPLLYNERDPLYGAEWVFLCFASLFNCKCQRYGKLDTLELKCVAVLECPSLCYWWYSILVLVFFKLFYFIGAVPPKSQLLFGGSPQTPLLLGGSPPNPPTIQFHKLPPC